MKSSPSTPWARYMLLDLISEGVAELARASAQRTQKRQSLCTGVRPWRCTRAGVDTPLWNTLARAVEAQLKRRGAKSRLARFLGISRQRLHLLIVAKTAYPDAERETDGARPDFGRRMKRLFPEGPPSGKPTSEAIMGCVTSGRQSWSEKVACSRRDCGSTRVTASRSMPSRFRRAGRKGGLPTKCRRARV
jgi:hypothetical protein